MGVELSDMDLMLTSWTVWYMAAEIAQAFDQVACMQIRFIRYSPRYFSWCFLTSILRPLIVLPAKSMILICVLSNSAREQRQEEANAAISTNRARASFCEKEYSYNIKGVSTPDTDKLQMRFH